MTHTMQVTRAGPVQPGGQTIMSTGRKDLQSSSSFFEILENQRSKEPDRVEDRRSPSRPEKEDERLKESADHRAADLKDPNGLAGTYTPVKPPQPDELPPEGSQDSAGESGPGGSGLITISTAQTGPENNDPAGKASLGASKTFEAQVSVSQAAAGTVQAGNSTALEDPAVQTQPAGDLQAAPTPTADAAAAQTDKSVQGVPVQTQTATPAEAAQRLANDMRLEGAVQATTHKGVSEARSSKDSGSESKAGTEQQPGNEPAKAPPTAGSGKNSTAPISLEGTTAPASQVFEPARLAEAQHKDTVWQICRNVETLIKNRQPVLHMVLYPEELGRIDLRLSTSSAGLGVTVMAEQASTNKLLESQMAQLRQSLNDAGIQLAHFSVGQQRNQSSSENGNPSSRGSHGGRSNRTSAIAAGDDVLHAPARFDTSELVDYRI